jgi:tRNA nucleotidyltransferase (CCA-adding enzyme)
MIKINIPENSQTIIKTLQNCGYKAYVVGGFVRSSIMQENPHDCDICTSAKPEEMKLVFHDHKIIETGIKHGTITVLIDDESFEVTTFRVDGEYSDNRRPDSVEFTSDLCEDLSRRDFTINAMAYNDEEGLIDPFHGYDDIKYKTIRCVGNPDDRFKEDALRILRAWRFSCTLNFNIDLVTLDSMYKNIDLLDNISKERIRDEFLKAFNSSGFIVKWLLSPKFIEKIIPELKAMHIPQNNPYHTYYVDIHTQNALATVKGEDLITRLAVLFHDIGKPHSYQDDENGIRHFRGHGKVSAEMTDNIMRRLRFDNETREKVIELVIHHDFEIPANKKQVKRWLNKLGYEQFIRLLKVKEADIKAQNPKFLDRLDDMYGVYIDLHEIKEEQECFSLKDLAVNGNDVKEYMYVKEGKDVGYWLNRILQLVIDENLTNDKDELIHYMIGVADGWIKE